jgi:Cu+-exporting ATPase
MIRRRFLQLATLSSAASLAALGMDNVSLAEAAAATLVVYRVKGFSCPTCAIGLDTLLLQQKGVRSSKSTYPEGKVSVQFQPEVISESGIRALIEEMGFTVEGETKG